MKFNPTDRIRMGLFVAGVLLAAARSASAHPFHATLAEVEVNREQQLLEIAMRVHPGDLEQALRQFTGEPALTLEKHPDLDARLQQYTARHFQVAAGGRSEPGKLRWVGHELDVKWAWLYFEIPIEPAAVDRMTITSTMFLELQDDQINTINLQDGHRKASIQCHIRQPESTVRWKSRPRPPITSAQLAPCPPRRFA